MNGRTNSNGTTTDTLQIPLDPVINLDAVAGNAQVTLTWTDPLNKYATPEGEQAGDPDQLVSVWQYTAIVRKEGSAPTGIHDGILVAESQVHNQYQTNGYVDNGLTNDTLYYYGLFAVNEDGIESEVTAISAMPKAGTLVQNLAVGTIININENGAPVEYQIVHQGNPDSSIYDESCDGTWVWRKYILDSTYYYGDARHDNGYDDSLLHLALNGEYLSNYSQDTLSLIKHIKLPYVYYASGGSSSGHLRTGSSGLDCQFYIYSRVEVGFEDDPDYHNDGIKLSYFDMGESDTACDKRVRLSVDGFSNEQWLRQSGKTGGDYTSTINYDGTEGGYMKTRRLAVTPACILSRDARVDQYFNLVTE